MNNTLPKEILRYRRHIQEVLQYKFTNNKMTPTRFIVFGRGRSGSTALVDLLDSVPNVWCDGEILCQRVLFPYAHVLAKCGNSKESIYGCKILSYQIRDVQPLANPQSFIQNLYKKGFKIIYLKRDNLLYHALSNIRARAFGFHNKQSENQDFKKINLDFNQLMRWLKSSEKLNEYEKLLLEDVPHLPITYEEHLGNPESHQSTVELICNFIDIECANAETKFRKVSPKTIRDSVENYDELVSFLKNTPYSKYLD